MGYKETVLADEPAFYWRCSDESGPALADASGNARTGTAQGGVTFAQRGLLRADASRALSLDGVLANDYQARVLADAPLAYWPLLEAGAPFADVSGGGYDLSVSGTVRPQAEAAPFAGTSGDRACGFGGDVSGYLINAGAPATIAQGGPWSIEAWIKAADDSCTYGNYALYADASIGPPTYDGPGIYCEFVHCSDIEDQLDCGSQLNGYTARDHIEPPVLGRWAHVVFCTEAGGARHLYVDGVDVGPSFGTDWSGGPPTAPSFVLGDGLPGWNEPFSGGLCHVAFYDHVLGPERVRAHYVGLVAPNAGTMVVQDGTSTLPAAATVEVWLQTTTTQGGVLAQFAAADATVADLTLYLRTDGVPAWRCGDTEIVRSGDRTVADGRIHHLVATLDGDAAAWLYVDGTQAAHAEGVTPSGPFTGRWQVGGGTTDDLAAPPLSAAYAGTIDEVAIYQDE